ncbi:hypothetical protein ACB094_02G017800 [Castanea mollissima]
MSINYTNQMIDGADHETYAYNSTVVVGPFSLLWQYFERRVTFKFRGHHGYFHRRKWTPWNHQEDHQSREPSWRIHQDKQSRQQNQHHQHHQLQQHQHRQQHNIISSSSIRISSTNIVNSSSIRISSTNRNNNNGSHHHHHSTPTGNHGIKAIGHSKTVEKHSHHQSNKVVVTHVDQKKKTQHIKKK